MAPPPSSSKLLLGRRAVSEFSGAQTPFLQQRGRETLEAHVRKKRLQHEWGLPSVVRRSLEAFLPSVVPQGSVLRKAKSRVETLPRKLGFLPKDTCIILEFHLQRMQLQQRWGLPRRVLETYRRLFPELPYKKKRVAVKPFSQQPRLGIRPPPGHPMQEEEKARKIQGLQLCPAQPFLMLKMKVLKKLQVHLTKKHLEVCLQSFPAAPRISWRSSCWSQERPLPKLILPGLTMPQTRIPCSSCGLAATGRIELALQRGRLASLWGLGLKYVEADAERPHPPDGTKELGFRSAEGKTPFFQPSAREDLEMHLRKKRIQHQWDHPSLVQRSLRSFSGHVSPLPPSKAVTQASVLPRELLFLPRRVTNFLEFHLQRMKLQKRWGLPRTTPVPKVFYKEKATLLVKQCSQKPGLGIKTQAGGLVEPRLDVRKTQGVELRPAQSLRRLSLPALKKLEVHLTKKHLEVCLETFPAVPRFSWRSLWLSTSRSLPKLILPGLKTPQTRRLCLSFDLVAMGRIELALQRGRLVSLWGLGLKYVETLAALSPGGPSAKFKEVPFEFSEVKFPFFKNAVKENLEMHIRKKRLQHEWGYSTLVQRSLRSLIGEAPQRPHGLLKAVTQTSLLRLGLHFLSEPVKQNLELHIQQMKLQRRWGLPQKVHRSVKFFHSPGPEEKPQAKFGLGETQTDSARWEETKVLLPKNEGCLEDLLRYTLETHLKKKSLEIKFQLIEYQMFSGPIKRVFLPKRSSMSSEIKPRTSCLYFVEQDIVGKINLNIKRKHLMHLWGLPNIYTTSLSKMFGTVIAGNLPLEMSKLRRWTLEKNIGWESQTAGAMGSRTKELRWSRKGPCFVQTEILDLLEMHVQRKKLQHEWGLPSMVQKSLQGFAALSLEPKRLLEGLGIATPGSWGALKVTIKITKSLFYLDLATQELLEAHVKIRTATHRWGLPSVEGDQGRGETQRHAYNRHFQTAAKQRHKAESVHRVITVKRSLPKAELLGKMSQQKISRSGRETQKMTSGKEIAPMFLNLEDLEFMGLHVRHKRIQHEWGLPILVQKSLQAFAPVPPDPQKKCLTSLARETFQDGRKASRVVHVPQPMIRVLVPTHAKDRLEYHVSCQTRQHKWGLPRVIQDSLRAMIPPPQVPDEKTQEGPPWWTSSWKDAIIKPMKNIHQRKPDARPSSGFPVAAIRSSEVRLLSYVRTSWNLLEFHVIHKKIQHKHAARRTLRSPGDKTDVETKAQQLWFLNTHTQRHLETSVRTMVTKHRSLHVFAPYLVQPERTTEKTTSRKPRRETRDVQILTQDLDYFLSFEVKERLEAHLRHRTSKHRWGLPERVRQSVRAFLPPTSPSRPGMTGFHPLVPLQPKFLQTTEDIYEPVMFKPEPKQKTLENRNVDDKRQTAKGRSWQTKAQACCGTKTGLPFLPEGSQNLLEFHILWKRIQHVWGLLPMVLQSLQAFAPHLLKAEKCTTGTVAKAPPCDGGEVQILSQDLDFLSVEEKELLEAHLRHLTSEHRWGLPERVQRSLRAFLPPRSPSHSEVTGSLPLLPYPPTATYVQPSWTSKGTEDLQILPCSSPSSYINYMSNVGKPERKVSFQKVNLGSGRTTSRVKNKMPLPGFEAKMDSWQKEDGSQRTTKQRGFLERLTPPPKPSIASRELKKSPKIPICLSYRSSAPQKTSSSLSKSDRQPKWPEKKKKKKKNQVQWEMGEAVVDDSSRLSEDNEAQDSPWSSGDNMEGSEESTGDDMSILLSKSQKLPRYIAGLGKFNHIMLPCLNKSHISSHTMFMFPIPPMRML
ncbi:hypothetical protein E2320_017892 [Naja naja]|nr:hypothetical protein E2320_017892 [Naja naja]